MKKFIVLYFVSLIVITMFILFNNKNDQILKLGDTLSLSINSYGIKSYDEIPSFKYIIYGKENYKIGELRRDIKENIKIQNIPIQNAINKSKVIILEIGMDEFIYSLSAADVYNYLDSMVINMKDLLKIIRKYNKSCKILLVGYYNPFLANNLNKYVKYINDRYNEISCQYNAKYVDINFLSEQEYFSNPNNYYLNDKGYNKLNELILNLI